MANVEEDYQVCARMLTRSAGTGQEKNKRKLTEPNKGLSSKNRDIFTILTFFNNC